MHHQMAHREKVIVMTAVMSALFLVALDQTIIATALSKIVEEFNSYSSLTWVVTAYMLTSTVTVPIAGKLSDIFGRRNVLIAGVSLFTLASLLSGSAQSIDQLIIYRAIQGIGGGVVMANAFTVIGDLFSPRERGKWQGITGGIFGLSSVIGPLLGGFLTDSQAILGLTTTWRWTFWINVPIGIISLYIIMRHMPQMKHEHVKKIDYLGAAFLTASLSSLILAVDNTEKIFVSLIDNGVELSMIRLTLIAITLASLAGFIWAERRAPEPIIPLQFFKNRTFTTIMIVAFLFGSAFLGAILYLTQFNQQVFGANATQAGLMLLPMIAGLSITAATTGRIVSKTGKYKAFIISGFSLATVAVFMLTTLTEASPYWHEAVIMLFVGIGMGAGMPIINLAVQNEFDQRDLGAATASSQLFRGLGSTIGTAVLGTMLTTQVTASLSDIKQDPYIQSLSKQPAIARQIGDINADTALILNTADMKTKVNDELARAISKQPLEIQTEIKQDALSKQNDFSNKVVRAFSDSLKNVFMTSAVIMLTATLIATGIKEKPLKGDGDETPGLE